MKKPAGTLSVCNDINFIRPFMGNPNIKTIYVGEAFQPNQLPQGFIPFSILLPPYEAIEAEINGDMNRYNQLYTQHLLSKDCVDAIATIATVLWAGTNIIMYIENGDALHHMQFLIKFFITNLGLIPETPQNPFAFDPAYSSIMVLLLYGFGKVQGITPFDVLREMPDLQTFVKLAQSPMFIHYNIIDKILFTLLGNAAFNLTNLGQIEAVLNDAFNMSKRNAMQLINFIQ